MQQQTTQSLEFYQILDMLKRQAVSQGAQTRIDDLIPILNEDLLQGAIRETADARDLIERFGLPPLAIMEGLKECVKLAEQGGLLSPEELSAVATFANTCRRLGLYLRKGEEVKIELSLNGRALMPLEDLQLEIENAIRGDTVADSASNQLRDIRRKITIAEEQVKQRLQRLLQNHKEWFSDAFVSIRSGRSTLPVKAQYKAMVPGSVVDRSGTGGTLFIEPATVRQAQDEVQMLRFDEENEVRRILYALTALVEACAGALHANMKLMERMDFAFAKARLALEMNAKRVPIERERTIKIVNGRHPLLDREKAVPLNFEMGGELRGVVITGPNTGGKTVSLKTIGLLSVMAQCGLQVPVGDGSRFTMSNLVLVDIGDGQNIQQNLSTFSAHMTQVLRILKAATRDSLVLLDELGSGTDPAEGMGIAVAVLEELSMRGCLFVVTTHYPEIKEFAAEAEGMANARMTFDPETFEPKYQLVLYEAGESCALHIARRLGFPEALLERAREAAYQADVRSGPVAAQRPSHRPAMVAVESTGARLQAYDKPKDAPERAKGFTRGDSVRVYPEGKVGIVCQQSDERGMIMVHMKSGKKQQVLHKRLKLIAKAEQMYPDDYDFSIVFDTVENRKARHTMERKHDPDAVVRYDKQ